MNLADWAVGWRTERSKASLGLGTKRSKSFFLAENRRGTSAATAVFEFVLVLHSTGHNFSLHMHPTM